MDFIKWPKIGQLHNVRKSVKARKRYHQVEGLDPYEPPVVTYFGKIKLDGANAAVSVSEGKYWCQSRSRIITPEDDNYGFARWVRDSGFGEHLVAQFPSQGGTYTIFGEWCGNGIQKRCAVSKLDRKIFASFAALCSTDFGALRTAPDSIDMLVGDFPDFYVLPWFEDITIDFSDPSSVEDAVEDLNSMVDKVENCDPWIRDTFGVEGLGEGIVFYPWSLVPSYQNQDERTVGTMESIGFWGFKAKGEKHQVVRQKQAVIADPEKVAGIDAFVAKFVTENRLEQGLQEACAGEADAKKTGDFLRWFGKDVKAESSAELEESGLEWKDVSKAVSTAARNWWMERCRA